METKPADVGMDLLGTGKAADKLLDVIARGVGKIYSDSIGPHVEARRAKISSAAEIEINHQQVLGHTETLLNADAVASRAGKRLMIKEIQRQKNIERTISLAAQQMPDSVSEDDVTTDWATRFFEVVQDVNDEGVRKIWARILTGELKQPGAFRLRTLEVLRSLSKDEAHTFASEISPLVFNRRFIVRINEKADLEKWGASYGSMLAMQDAGLIFSQNDLVRQLNDSEEGKETMYHGNTQIVATSEAPFRLPVLVMTHAGSELYKVTEFEPNLQYRRDVISYLEESGLNVNVLSGSKA